MNTNSEIIMAVGSIPASMFFLSSIGANTAAMAKNDDAVKQGLTVASAGLIIAAASTGSVPTTLVTALAVAGTLYIMRNVWNVPEIIPNQD